MQQADAPDVSESTPVITSLAAPLQPAQKIGSTSEDDSNNTIVSLIYLGQQAEFRDLNATRGCDWCLRIDS
eukprot:7860166-Pyramimonas_sp.AAC.1